MDKLSDAIDHKPLKEEIFNILYKRIIGGKCAPGEWLRQEDISFQLGVSQTPVREALDLLVSSGLAERIPYRGVRVLQLSVEEIIDSYGLRLLIESTAAAITAVNRDQIQLSTYYQLIEKTKALVTLNDMPLQMQINREFHHAIVAGSRNSLMTRVFDMISHQFPDWMLYEYMFRHPELLQSSLSKEYMEHKSIVDAIAANRPEEAAQNVLIHIKNLGNELVEYLNIPRILVDQKENQMIYVQTNNWKN